MSELQPHSTASVAPLGPGGQGWAGASIPVEVFESIGAMLSRDDLLRMRLVSHEFEKKISAYIFKSVVVPFKPDIYGMSSTNTAKIALPASKVVNDTGKSIKSSNESFIRDNEQHTDV